MKDLLLHCKKSLKAIPVKNLDQFLYLEIIILTYLMLDVIIITVKVPNL